MSNGRPSTQGLGCAMFPTLKQGTSRTLRRFFARRGTSELFQDYPPGKGVKFYLIQHYETYCGPKERVDATWRAPLHKVVIAQWLFETGRGLGCEHMQYVPNGIDHEKYRLLNPISNRAKRVAMLFNTADWKGSPDGLWALGAVKSQHPDLQAALFGTPQRSESIPDWIEYYQNPPQRELVSSIYNETSVFVCSSWSEGFGLPPAEAMACGCAVASTDCGGVRKLPSTKSRLCCRLLVTLKPWPEISLACLTTTV